MDGGRRTTAGRRPDGRDGRPLAYPDSRFATVDGVDVHYLDNADGAGATHGTEPSGRVGALLSHHFYGSAATWRPVLRRLDGVYAAALDRPGFGLTQRPPATHRDGDANPYTRAGSARLGWRLLDHLSVTGAVLVGSSAGGTHALEMYARRPDDVRAIVLIGAAITGDVGAPPPLRPALRTRAGRAIGPQVIRRLAGEVTVDRVTRSWADASRAGPGNLEPYRRMLTAEGWERGLWEVFTAEPPPDLRWLLPRIEVPTLVVTGDRDPVVRPTASRRTAAAIPGARLEVIDDCGHTPQEERPDRLAGILREFFADALA